ncbi:MAG: glutamate ligase domain-containing protein, partial [Actinomycetota bacterium]
ERFVQNIRGPRVLCADDPVCARIAQICDATTYSIADNSSADYLAGEIKFADGGATFDVSTRSGSMLRRLGRVHIAQRGLHNVSNAMAAIAMAMKLGVEFEDAASGLAKFGGVARRFDVRGVHDGVTFVDDYAHLPAEISAVLAGLGDGTDTWSRVVAVFQPNRFNRMAQISHLYADSFEQADLVVVTDIYSSGTTPIAGVTGQLVVDAIRAAHPDCNLVYQPQRGDLVEFLAGELKSGDICISMGCGDIESLPEEVIARRKR